MRWSQTDFLESWERSGESGNTGQIESAGQEDPEGES